jgi:hypothetical protein
MTDDDNANALRPQRPKPEAETVSRSYGETDIDAAWRMREYIQPVKNAKRLFDYRLCRNHGWNTRPFGWNW